MLSFFVHPHDHIVVMTILSQSRDAQMGARTLASFEFASTFYEAQRRVAPGDIATHLFGQ